MLNNPITVHQLEIGPMKNFVYLIANTTSKECFVVDPAWDMSAITKNIDDLGLTLKGALVSHYHPDHCGGKLWGHDIAGIVDLLNIHPVPIYVNSNEVEGICLVTGLSKRDLKPVSGGDEVFLGSVPIKLIHTPGHTPGSQCFLCCNNLISGDTLFLTNCGRVDLPGGNSEQLYYSITQTLAKLPSETTVFPGHNYDIKKTATIKELLSLNPYLSAKSMKEWQSLP